MKIILSGKTYLADINNDGLTEGWSESIVDAMPMTEEQAAKKLAAYKILIPGKPVFVLDAGPESVGRPLTPARIEEMRKQFVASQARRTT